jgi:hypothetical protein
LNGAGETETDRVAVELVDGEKTTELDAAVEKVDAGLPVVLVTAAKVAVTVNVMLFEEVTVTAAVRGVLKVLLELREGEKGKARSTGALALGDIDALGVCVEALEGGRTVRMVEKEGA